MTIIQKGERMSDLISRQAAIDATSEIVFVEYEDGDPRKEESIILQTKAAIRDGIKALPSVYVPEMNVGDMISRQAAIDALMVAINDVGILDGDDIRVVFDNLPSTQPTITHEQAIDYLHETGWLQNHDRILTESKIVLPVQPTQTNCEYCHTDRDGYVFPLEKNSHAFIDRDKIVLKANGWRGEAKIKYCPICGRRLTDDTD